MLNTIWNFLNNNSQEIQALMAIISAAAIVVTGYLAWKIGKKQNEINKRALEIQDFVELFIMLQEINIVESMPTMVTTKKWKILIKNAGNYPVYLTQFTLNETNHGLGKNVIPTGLDNWYEIPILNNVKEKGNLLLEVKFEDYMGRKYSCKATGKFENESWNIKTEKKVEIK